MTPDEHEKAKLLELIEAGRPFGLSSAEVTAARATGMSLGRYAAIKNAPTTVGGGRSVGALIAAQRAADANAGGAR